MMLHTHSRIYYEMHIRTFALQDIMQSHNNCQDFYITLRRHDLSSISRLCRINMNYMGYLMHKIIPNYSQALNRKAWLHIAWIAGKQYFSWNYTHAFLFSGLGVYQGRGQEISCISDVSTSLIVRFSHLLNYINKTYTIFT